MTRRVFIGSSEASPGDPKAAHERAASRPQSPITFGMAPRKRE
jgi:hypothetical protein